MWYVDLSLCWRWTLEMQVYTCLTTPLWYENSNFANETLVCTHGQKFNESINGEIYLKKLWQSWSRSSIVVDKKLLAWF